MPQFNSRIPQFRPKKPAEAEWETFKDGLNLFKRPTELDDTELAQADNIMLVGSGVPTGRWGTSTYFSVNATGAIRGFATYNNVISATSEIIALSDEGYLGKKNGSSYTRINGQSYPSGSMIRSEQLGGFTYVVSKDRPLTRYNGTDLAVFATLSAPTGATATNVSGVSGTTTYSWKIVTLSVNGGQTTPSTPIELPNLPQDLSRTEVHVRWTAPSAAASTINGYEIYRGQLGDETFLAAVGASTTLFIDQGEEASPLILAPITNTTGGVKSRIIVKDTVGDRLLLVDESDPTKLIISGRYPNQSKFSWADGGGYVYVGPDDGDRITGIAVQPGSERITVFKNYASYSVLLSTVQIGNYTVLDPQVQPISSSIGCSSPDTIQTVENDVFYFGRKGLYVVGFEPNFLSLIRTNEISARMRPYLETLTKSDFEEAVAMYVNNKYLLSFPRKKEILCYDRERGCFAGLWKLPFGVSHMKKFVDESGTERWIIGVDNDNQTYTFEPSVNSDSGTTITKTLRTKKEDFGTWSLLKIIKLFYILFRRITGSVTVNILLEDRSGATTTAKSFTITGSSIAGQSGWGVNTWGSIEYGLTIGTPVIAGDELTKWGQIFKSMRLIQIEVTSTAANSNFELLGVRLTASSQGEGSLSSSQRV